MEQPRRFPVGVQTFSEIIKGKYAYVDKTALVHQLANYGKCLFLSRPRRFGKSLLVSTLEAYFKGEKELFKGLAMEQLETEWEQYPVLRLDLNVPNYAGFGTAALIDKLNTFLTENEQQCGYESQVQDFGVRFEQLIKRFTEQSGKQVVVLIDEYDKPLTDTINNDELNMQMREILRGFYSTLKSQDENIHFALLTGVSKFSHVTIFSGLNNLEDITMYPDFANICGITEQELHDNFNADIHRLADKYGYTQAEAYDKLRENYDGYRFAPESEISVYNPYSIIRCLKISTLQDFWFSTGTPTFLIKLLQQGEQDLTELDGDVEANIDDLSDIDTHTNQIAVMYQSGYLTIKDYDPQLDIYLLGFPNGEVRRGFNRHLVKQYLANLTRNERNSIARQLFNAVAGGDVEKMMDIFKQVLGGTPCHSTNERQLEVHYRNTIYLMLVMCGHRAEVEKQTAMGRIDVSLETDDYVYVMELKRGKTDEAATQIEDRHYLDAYAADKRKVLALAVAINDETRNIGNWRQLDA